ncbi:hypothetical protein BKA80DRAFT_307385 [Phyllosticta citrichinensis]
MSAPTATTEPLNRNYTSESDSDVQARGGRRAKALAPHVGPASEEPLPHLTKPAGTAEPFTFIFIDPEHLPDIEAFSFVKNPSLTNPPTGTLLKGATDADGKQKDPALLLGIKLDLDAEIHLTARVRGDIAIGLY